MVKRAEALHDSKLYRMYELEARKIRAQGGKIRRVVLDYELKSQVFAPLAKLDTSIKSEFYRHQERIARRHHLPIIRRKIVFPDVRIEYDTYYRERARVDLELASQHYKAAQIAQKMEAGFTVYMDPHSPYGARKLLPLIYVTLYN